MIHTVGEEVSKSYFSVEFLVGDFGIVPSSFCFVWDPGMLPTREGLFWKQAQHVVPYTELPLPLWFIITLE